MTWTDFYLICFAVGFLLSLVSVAAGSVHLPHIHVHADLHAHAPHTGGDIGGEVSPINFGTIAAFLAWFGGTGYLLQRFSNIWFLLALGIAFVSGLGGAALVFLFLARVLMRQEEALDPADYDMIGVLGKISSAVRPGGTGEIIFSQAGARRSAPARSEDGMAIHKGAEVVVTRYEKGIAYVRRWEDLTSPPELDSQKENA